mmetsp:Transcript_14057/g.18332  ORF Transcript_14057/g.18332 Transcript_14057/m.18332 type:complete len:89 (-) Transcript_14057:355-621(-)
MPVFSTIGSTMRMFVLTAVVALLTVTNASEDPAHMIACENFLKYMKQENCGGPLCGAPVQGEESQDCLEIWEAFEEAGCCNRRLRIKF